MSDGGFLIKFDQKEAFRCHAVAFDYDMGTCIANNADKKEIPKGTKTITIVVENNQPK